MRLQNRATDSWPFLYHGMEQENLDSWSLYWEPNGNVYNPDPFQLSLGGPQGLGGGGGGGPRSLGGGGGGGAGYNYAQNATNGAAIGGSYAAIMAYEAAPDLAGPWGLAAAGAFDIFASLGLFGGGGGPSISLYDFVHTQRRAHDVYCEVLGICGAVVTQQGNIVLAEDNEEEPEEKVTDENQFFGRAFAGQRPVIPYGGIDVPLEDGTIVHIPEGSEIGPARNGKGYRFQTGKPGREVRIMGPRPELPWSAPNGYVVWNNSPQGQAVDPATMRTLPDSAAHFRILP
jgi:hypothetical protein